MQIDRIRSHIANGVSNNEQVAEWTIEPHTYLGMFDPNVLNDRSSTQCPTNPVDLCIVITVHDFTEDGKVVELHILTRIGAIIPIHADAIALEHTIPRPGAADRHIIHNNM